MFCFVGVGITNLIVTFLSIMLSQILIRPLWQWVLCEKCSFSLFFCALSMLADSPGKKKTIQLCSAYPSHLAELWCLLPSCLSVQDMLSRYTTLLLRVVSGTVLWTKVNWFIVRNQLTLSVLLHTLKGQQSFRYRWDEDVLNENWYTHYQQIHFFLGNFTWLIYCKDSDFESVSQKGSSQVVKGCPLRLMTNWVKGAGNSECDFNLAMMDLHIPAKWVFWDPQQQCSQQIETRN